MEFEYNEDKSKRNKDKHGIDFIEAKLLWGDVNARVIPAKLVGDEQRYALVSKLNGKCYVAVFTIRNTAYRVISVRRCRKNEEPLYGKN